MTNDEKPYGGVTDPDYLAWLKKNYPPKPDNTRADTTGEQGKESHYGNKN